MRKIRNAHEILFGKPQGKRFRRRWDADIKMNLKTMGCDYVDCIHVAQVKVWCHCCVSTVVEFQVM